jgi:hypothetical protein
MIKNTLVTDSTLTVSPTLVYTSTTTGDTSGTVYGAFGGNVTAAPISTAVTTIALCNTTTPTVTNETTGAVTVNVYFVRYAESYDTTLNLVVSNLVIPAGETVFFSEERMVLAAGDKIYIGANTGSRIISTVSALPV